MAKRDRSSSLLFVALCAAVGCTAIVEGELEPSPAIPPAPHGSQPSGVGVGGAFASGGESPEPYGASGGPKSDVSDAGAASDPVAADVGGAGALENYGAGAGGEPLASGGMTAGGAEHAGAGDAAGGAPTLGAAGAGGDGGSAGAPSGTTGDVITWQGPLPVGDPAEGHLLVIADKCAGCHAEDLGGRGFYRNITPDIETGIGSWTDRQIANAIRGGGGPGTQFCSLMPLYSGLKDRQIADMVAYLRSLPAISNKIIPMCPGHYPPGG